MNKQRTPQDWQHIFQQFNASGLTATSFCKQHKLTVSNFYSWRKKLALSQPPIPVESTVPNHWLLRTFLPS